ncbi:MAG: OmpH family outer membrane protein [Desulfovibrionaceae bacterium]
MRRVFLLAIAAVLLMANVALAEVKIGVVDMQVVATQSDPAKDAQTRMKSKYGAERDQLEKQAKSLQSKAEGLKNGKDISEDKKVEFIRLKRDLDEKTRNFARKVEQDEVKIRQDMVTLVFRAAYEVAQRKGINFMVDVTAGGVLYADQSMDMTKDVMAEVNKLWKSGAIEGAPKKGKK